MLASQWTTDGDFIFRPCV